MGACRCAPPARDHPRLLTQLLCVHTGNYENRLRELSSPEKVFEYFASVQRDGEWFMTPDDFFRAITPFVGRAADRLGTANSKFAFMAGKGGQVRRAAPSPPPRLRPPRDAGVVSPSSATATRRPLTRRARPPRPCPRRSRPGAATSSPWSTSTATA